MKKTFLFLSILFCSYQTVPASSIKTAEISIQAIDDSTHTFKVTVRLVRANYTSSPDSIVIKWIDGFAGSVSIVDTTVLDSVFSLFTYSAFHSIQNIPADSIIKVSFNYLNRPQNIINIFSSIDEPLYIEAIIDLKSLSIPWMNSPPLLTNFQPPIDSANLIISENPGAYDPEGDSLFFKMIIPMADDGLSVSNYTNPNQIPGTIGTPTFIIDSMTGNLIWDAPQICAYYSFAFKTSEYRNGLFLGSIMKDEIIQIVCVAPSTIEENKSAKINISPNPANENLFIHQSQQSTPACVQLFNYTGQLIFENKNFAAESIDTKNLQNGFYVLKYSTYGNYEVKKFLVQH